MRRRPALSAAEVMLGLLLAPWCAAFSPLSTWLSLTPLTPGLHGRGHWTPSCAENIGGGGTLDESGWGSNRNSQMVGSPTFSAPMGGSVGNIGNGMAGSGESSGSLTSTVSSSMLTTAVGTPLKAMVFVDGTWLYYSFHERGILCPIRKEFGANWQDRYEINWAMVPRIIARAIEEEMRSSLLVDRHVEVTRTVVFTSAKASTPAASRRIQMFRDMQNANMEVHMSTTAGEREKCVDIALAVEMMHYATTPGAYEVAVLVTGDKDFMPAMARTRQRGKRVALATMRQHCNRDLLAPQSHVRDYHPIFLEQSLRDFIQPSYGSGGAAGSDGSSHGGGGGGTSFPRARAMSAGFAPLPRHPGTTPVVLPTGGAAGGGPAAGGFPGSPSPPATMGGSRSSSSTAAADSAAAVAGTFGGGFPTPKTAATTAAARDESTADDAPLHQAAPPSLSDRRTLLAVQSNEASLDRAVRAAIRDIVAEHDVDGNGAAMSARDVGRALTVKQVGEYDALSVLKAIQPNGGLYRFCTERHSDAFVVTRQTDQQQQQQPSSSSASSASGGNGRRRDGDGSSANGHNNQRPRVRGASFARFNNRNRSMDFLIALRNPIAGVGGMVVGSEDDGVDDEDDGDVRDGFADDLDDREHNGDEKENGTQRGKKVVVGAALDLRNDDAAGSNGGAEGTAEASAAGRDLVLPLEDVFILEDPIIDAMLLPELKEWLRSLGKPVFGRKHELVQRLKNAVAEYHSDAPPLQEEEEDESDDGVASVASSASSATSAGGHSAEGKSGDSSSSSSSSSTRSSSSSSSSSSGSAEVDRVEQELVQLVKAFVASSEGGSGVSSSRDVGRHLKSRRLKSLGHSPALVSVKRIYGGLQAFLRLFPDDFELHRGVEPPKKEKEPVAWKPSTATTFAAAANVTATTAAINSTVGGDDGNKVEGANGSRGEYRGNGDGGGSGDDSSSASPLPRDPGTNEKDVTDWVVLVDRAGASSVSLDDNAAPGVGGNGSERNGSDSDLAAGGEDWEDDLYVLLNG